MGVVDEILMDFFSYPPQDVDHLAEFFVVKCNENRGGRGMHLLWNKKITYCNLFIINKFKRTLSKSASVLKKKCKFAPVIRRE